MRRMWVALAALVLAGCGASGNATATRGVELTQIAALTAPTARAVQTPSSGPTQQPQSASTANATPSSAPQQAATQAAPPVAPTAGPPQVVTVKEEAVNLRQSADVASAVVALLPPGTDALVIGEDTTGPDGVTRYIHARVGDKEGYLRSDLVSAPHVATPAPPTPTPTPDFEAEYPIIDAADWVKRPDYYTGKRFSVIGEAFNVRESGGVTTFQVWAETSLDRTVPVGVVFRNTSTLIDGQKLRAYGVGKGTFTGTNGFGASVTQPVMDAVQIGPPVRASNSAGATASAINSGATGTALAVRVATASVQTNNVIATSKAVNATADAVIQRTYATLTAVAKP